MQESNQKQNDEDIPRKEALMKQEIIDKNYNKDAFIEFCIKKRKYGDDLTVWTYNELVSVIREFQKENQPAYLKDMIQLDEIIKDGAIDIDDNPEEEDNNNNNLNQNLKKNLNETEITCQTLQRTELSNNMLSITLQNPKEMDTGVFSSSYVVYEVKTEPFGWVVDRRYSDFYNLRNVLVKTFPGINVPPIPGKKIGSRRFDLDFVLKRMKMLEFFINQVAANESLKCSDVLISFLQSKDRGLFERKIKEVSSKEDKIYLDTLKTLDGKAILSHDEKTDKYCHNMSRYFSLQEQVMNRLNYFLKQFLNYSYEASLALRNVGVTFKFLNTLSAKILTRQTVTRTYGELEVFFTNWSKIMDYQAEIVKEHIKDFYKYVNLEGKSFNDFVSIRNDIKIKYMNEKTKLQNKKERLWASRDIDKFETFGAINMDRNKMLNDKEYAFKFICYREDQQVKNIYDKLGYYNKCSIVELKKMFRKYRVDFLHNLKRFNEKFYMSVKDFVGTWNNMEQFIVSLPLETKYKK